MKDDTSDHLSYLQICSNLLEFTDFQQAELNPEV
jgi:hypothetical protein